MVDRRRLRPLIAMPAAEAEPVTPSIQGIECSDTPSPLSLGSAESNRARSVSPTMVRASALFDPFENDRADERVTAFTIRLLGVQGKPRNECQIHKKYFNVKSRIPLKRDIKGKWQYNHPRIVIPLRKEADGRIAYRRLMLRK